jgi:hypothetical protein
MASSKEEGLETEEIYFDLDDSNSDVVSFDSHKSSSQRASAADIKVIDNSNQNGKLVHTKFDEFLIRAIDDALSILGEPVKYTLYQRLQSDFCITKEKIPENIEEFCSIIHKIFGLGANRLEIRVIKNLCLKVQADTASTACEGSVSEWIVNDSSFIEQVEKLRQIFEKNKPSSP